LSLESWLKACQIVNAGNEKSTIYGLVSGKIGRGSTGKNKRNRVYSSFSKQDLSII